MAPSASAFRDVLAATGRVHVRRGRVHGEQDQVLDLRVERALTPRNARELRVRGEEVGVELEQPAERLVPEAARLDELVPQALPALVEAHRYVTPTSA